MNAVVVPDRAGFNCDGGANEGVAGWSVFELKLVFHLLEDLVHRKSVLTLHSSRDVGEPRSMGYGTFYVRPFTFPRDSSVPSTFSEVEPAVLQVLAVSNPATSKFHVNATALPVVDLELQDSYAGPLRISEDEGEEKKGADDTHQQLRTDITMVDATSEMFKLKDEDRAYYGRRPLFALRTVSRAKRAREAAHFFVCVIYDVTYHQLLHSNAHPDHVQEALALSMLAKNAILDEDVSLTLLQEEDLSVVAGKFKVTIPLVMNIYDRAMAEIQARVVSILKARDQLIDNGIRHLLEWYQLRDFVDLPPRSPAISTEEWTFWKNKNLRPKRAVSDEETERRADIVLQHLVFLARVCGYSKSPWCKERVRAILHDNDEGEQGRDGAGLGVGS
ncbi:hypothetical protein CALVIDRAFT_568603 [Calocera viscosa TUFC12733]|uniref:Uncharacterized protein n=1 Tax=Calocera viscosa (strain TUFC12733) TaxID=1330018 RepID=A0A167GUK8_CALVF|nr:hypothetical protein CALVIDRAFT_568603 [Calocera viscosa TUFC12733]